MNEIWVTQHEYNTNSHNIENLCIRSIKSNIFNLLENFLDIINKKCCLIMGAKYYNSSINDACTFYLANIVGLPAKVVQPTAFFSEKNVLFVWFCVGHWLADLGVSS